jgi:hypothetical protein
MFETALTNNPPFAGFMGPVIHGKERIVNCATMTAIPGIAWYFAPHPEARLSKRRQIPIGNTTQSQIIPF